MEPKLQEKIQGDEHEHSIFGHIFMIISIPTLHGPKEDAYGFYSEASVTPVKENATAIEKLQNIKLQIRGPGLTRSEFRCGVKDDCNVKSDDDRKELKRFSESVDSVRIPITEDQRKKIIGEVETWDHAEYNLFTKNCNDFISAVAEDLKYPSPDRLLVPEMYLKALKNNVATEDQRRETEHALSSLPRRRTKPGKPQTTKEVLANLSMAAKERERSGWESILSLQEQTQTMLYGEAFGFLHHRPKRTSHASTPMRHERRAEVESMPSCRDHLHFDSDGRDLV
jgi:hypothetical protein